MKFSLSIVIPTFNRPEALLRTATAVAEQLREGEELVILDNASETPATEILREFLVDGGALVNGGRIRVERNAANVGMSANFALCFQKVASEWLWIFGDDDVILPNALDVAREAILAADAEVCWTMFSVKNRIAYERETVASYEELLGRMKEVAFAGNMVFISSCIFRVKPCLAFSHYGFHFANTLASYAVYGMLAMRAGGRMLLWPGEVVQPTEGVADGYPLLPAYQGMMVFLDIKDLRAPGYTEAIRALSYSFSVRTREMLTLLCRARSDEMRYWFFRMGYWMGCATWKKRLQLAGLMALCVGFRWVPYLKTWVAGRLGVVEESRAAWMARI